MLAGFIFTTAPPPPICAAATAADTSRNPNGSASAIRIAQVKTALSAAALPIMPTNSHIVLLMVGDPQKCEAASHLLFSEHGIYIQLINFPTVARRIEHLRITPSPFRDDALIAELTKALVDIWRRLDLPFTVDGSLAR
jgi:5-aminolevulinate synthase